MFNNKRPADLDRENVPGEDELSSKMKNVSAKEAELQAQLDAAAKEREEIAQLQQMKSKFRQDRIDLSEHVSRAINFLEGRQNDLEETLKQIKEHYRNLQEIKQIVGSLDETQWKSDHFKEELEQSSSKLAEAQQRYDQTYDETEYLRDENSSLTSSAKETFTNPFEGGFGAIAWTGFAFSLPLLILGTIFIFIYAVKHS